MTDIIRQYLSSHPKPTPFPLAQEFGITVAEARVAIAEHLSAPRVSIEAENTPDSIKEKGKSYAKTLPKKEKGFHDFMSVHPVALWSIRIVAFIIGIATLVRSFYLIVDYNGGFSDPRALLMPFIFQGLSLIFPILSYIELRKRTIGSVLASAALLCLALASMTYEFRVSLDGFLTASYANVRAPGNEDEQIGTLQDQIDANKGLIRNEEKLLEKRQLEFKDMAMDDKNYKVTQARINSILRDIQDLSSANSGYQSKVLLLQQSKPKEAKKLTLATLFGIDESIYTRVIIIMQSLLLILATPICFGVALIFGKGD